MDQYYSNDDLTRNVAFGWLNSRGARFVQDGISETKMELQYREYARKMELDFPQTAKVSSIIADDYHWEAKHDHLDSELFLNKRHRPMGSCSNPEPIR